MAQAGAGSARHGHRVVPACLSACLSAYLAACLPVCLCLRGTYVLVEQSSEVPYAVDALGLAIAAAVQGLARQLQTACSRQAKQQARPSSQQLVTPWPVLHLCSNWHG